MKNCPSDRELREYLLGRLPPETLEIVAGHLDHCPSCQMTLAGFSDSEDTLVEQLRHCVGPDEFAEEAGCRELIARAKISWADLSSQGSPSNSTPADWEIRGVLGEYQLLARLGEGGMGCVFMARHTRLDRIVALKVIARDRVGNPQAAARFEREMQAIGRLSHPNIVQAHDAREIEGTSVLVMEFVEGVDLGDLIRQQGPLPIAEACELARQAALGLQYAHENGLVHRDVKPSNLMLDREGRVKILDLGLALLADESAAAEGLTSAGHALGTADYVAPEQLADSHGVDIRADIYSLGCTLYHLLTGQAPFSAKQYQRPFEKLVGHVRDAAPDARRLRPDVPPGLAAVLGRMLAKEPDGRFSQPREAAEALAPLAAGADLVRLVAQSGSDSPPTTPNAIPLPVKRRVPRWFLPAVLVALAGLLAAAVIITIRDRRGNETELETPSGSKIAVKEDGRIEVSLSTPLRNNDSVREQNAKKSSSLAPIQFGRWIEMPIESDQVLWSPVGDPDHAKYGRCKSSNGVLETWNARVIFPIDAKNMRIRVKVKKNAGDGGYGENVGLTLRESAYGGYGTWFNGGNNFGILKNNYHKTKTQARFVDLAGTFVTKSYKDFFEYEFRAIDDMLTVLVDGEIILQVRDDSFSSGYAYIGSHRCTSEFAKVEIFIPDEESLIADNRPGIWQWPEEDRPGAELPNVLTLSEQAAGWQLLFDGKSDKGWKAIYRLPYRKGYQIDNGTLELCYPRYRLATVEEFDDFELCFQWRVAPRSTGGVYYRVSRDETKVWDPPGMRIQDNALGGQPAGSVVHIDNAPPDAARPVGQWNQARLIVRGNHVEHWLNGRKAASCEIGSPQFKEQVKKNHLDPEYGKTPKGFLVLQSESGTVAFRNIKIRPLPKSHPDAHQSPNKKD
ncbi:MAG: DUF1080 domain-containing protein [Pirellulales bacterium]|nr:DUF1080 domain-containing protein [Pirellulales bacterium]